MEITKLLIGQNGYPNQLRQLKDPPKQLYYAGVAPNQQLQSASLAIVGSRSASHYGQQVTQQLASECARAGVTIVSGLAFGIDSYAHQAALQTNGNTIAVLPCGLNNVYPASHQRLAQQIINQGGTLISEYHGNTSPMKHQFIARNRIIAGLCQAVVVAEATLKSGSLHTAKFAQSLGRPVLAIPGNINNPNYQGCNNLIKNYQAQLITCAEDIFNILQILPATARASPKGDTPAEQTILKLIEKGVNTGAQILAQSQLDASTYNMSLTMLEVKGQVRSLGGDNWAI